MLCSEACIVKDAGDRIRVATLFCRSWSCETCAPKRARQVSRQLRDGVPTKFLTLTVNPSRYSGPVERATRLADAFRKWVRRLRKAFPGVEVEYYCVFERTQAGEPHLHVLGRWPYVNQREISAFFEAEISAPIVDVRAVRSKRGASRYVSKYLSKDCAKFGNLKRYFKSRGYCEPRLKTKDEQPWNQVKWQRLDWPMHDVMTHYAIRGWEVVGDARKDFIEWREPEQPRSPRCARSPPSSLSCSPFGLR